MATIKQRLLKKNSSGTYDTIHLETSVDCLTGILPVSKGGTGANTLSGLANSIASSMSSAIIKYGTYTPTEDSTTVNLGAKPKVVIVFCSGIPCTVEFTIISTSTYAGYVGGANINAPIYAKVTITSTGFTATGVASSAYTYPYIAFM